MGGLSRGEPLGAEVREHLVPLPAEDLRRQQAADYRLECDAAVADSFVVARHRRHCSHRGESVGWDRSVDHTCLCDVTAAEIGNDLPRRFVEQPCEFRGIFAGADECVDLAAVEDHRRAPVRADLDVRSVHSPANRDLSTADPRDGAGPPAHRKLPRDESGHVGSVGTRRVHDDVDVETAPVGQSN